MEIACALVIGCSDLKETVFSPDADMKELCRSFSESLVLKTDCIFLYSFPDSKACTRSLKLFICI